jgi:chromosome segregation ATPase
VDGVQKARDAQENAKEQFASALDEFIAVTRVDGGELEATYKRLQRELEQSEDRAETVRSRITSIERVGDALFREWEHELNEYSSESLRASSRAQLDSTQDRYEELLTAMHRAESKMEPVLSAFRDQVLFLKHNLNARAIASLEGTVGKLEQEIGALIRDMEASIAEANAFIDSMGS